MIAGKIIKSAQKEHFPQKWYFFFVLLHSNLPASCIDICIAKAICSSSVILAKSGKLSSLCKKHKKINIFLNYHTNNKQTCSVDMAKARCNMASSEFGSSTVAATVAVLPVVVFSALLPVSVSVVPPARRCSSS